MQSKHHPPLTTLVAGVALTAGYAPAVLADEVTHLTPVVITAPGMLDAGRVETDPKQPRLPLPAHDGGSYLKSIPGFTVSRKGGTSGDPELRGQGGSRLNILLDGANIHGGCGGRMDPPTAYVYPEAYDRIEIIKGPQSVRYGAVTAGVVQFERDTPRFTEPDTQGHTSFTTGSFGRTDAMADVTSGGELGYARVIGTVSSQDDYKDGDSDRVHSHYQRWSATGILGWTPDDKTKVEFAYDRSDGHAAYDDRERDGTKFDRTGYTLSATRRDLSPLVAEVSGKVYYNYIDHWMDSFRLVDEPPTGMAMDNPTMNPDRLTQGGRVSADLTPTANLWMTVGIDYMEDEHTRRMRLDVPRNDNAAFEQSGVFAELEQELTPRNRINAGLRVDQNEAEALSEGMDGFGGADAGTTDKNTLTSGFLRYSQDLASVPASVYLGVGRSERAPDFWERGQVFDLDTEALTQIDTGIGYASGPLKANAALFYGQFDDYILMGGTEDAQNIDATHYGLEADTTYRLTPVLSTTATIAWVRADNDTDNEPLAQTPPMETTLSIDYDNGRSFGGVLARNVAKQDRIHEDYGTIYSHDIEETSGFTVFSLYSGHRFTEQVTATLGIDNVLDETYAEHIQQGGGGYLTPTGELVNEPGRTAWARVSSTF